jgi:hypothetical protein
MIHKVRIIVAGTPDGDKFKEWTVSSRVFNLMVASLELGQSTGETVVTEQSN